MENLSDRNPFSWNMFADMPVVGILRNFSLVQIQNIIPGFVRSGLTTVEVTMNTIGATDIISYLSKTYKNSLNVGAGTVCNLADLECALEAGAQFVVTPAINEEVIKRCIALEIPIFPGAFTPTEILKAWSLGASLVKLFPGGLLGVDYLKELRGPLPQVKLLPTGGVNLVNSITFFEAGAAGVGMGGRLFDRKLVEACDWDALTARFSFLVNQIRAYRNPA